MSLDEQTELKNLLVEFRDVFSTGGLSGCTSVVKHSIPTTGMPIHQPLRRVPEALKETIESEVTRMLEQSVIRPSTSPNGSEE